MTQITHVFTICKVTAAQNDTKASAIDKYSGKSCKRLKNFGCKNNLKVHYKIGLSPAALLSGVAVCS